MLIAQISDTHISVPDKKAYGIVPTAENLFLCIKEINQTVPQPELVLVTGDLTNYGLLEEMEHVKSLLSALEMPYFVIPGNHDQRDNMWAVFHADACPVNDPDFINYVIETDSIRLIGLDSSDPGKPGGMITAQQIDWLMKVLDTDKKRPTLLFMHHPPLKFGVRETDIDGFSGAEAFAELIRQYDNIIAILSGHIHTMAHTLWCGTVVSTAPSLGMKLVLDLELKTELFVHDAPAYQLHYWTREQQLISHNVTVRALDGPYMFTEKQT